MKKSLMAVGLLFGLLFTVGKSYAGIPLTKDAGLDGTYGHAINFNLGVYGSTNPASSTSGSIVFAVVQATYQVSNNGGTSSTNGGTNGVSVATVTARTCLDYIEASLSTGTTIYILDGGTTDYTIYGSNLILYSGQTAVEYKHVWNAGEPFCGTTGNTLTISIPAPTVNTATNAVNVEGYTIFSGAGQTYNSGQ